MPVISYRYCANTWAPITSQLLPAPSVKYILMYFWSPITSEFFPLSIQQTSIYFIYNAIYFIYETVESGGGPIFKVVLAC